jgi:hypothetical protein
MENRISRRRMLRRIGAGAAVAWSAPVLSSLRTPAFAQGYPPRCPAGCPACPPVGCGTGPSGDCLCFPPTDGSECFCTFPRACDAAGGCRTDAQCPSGFKCVFSCCPQTITAPGTCAQPCEFAGRTAAPAAGELTQAG